MSDILAQVASNVDASRNAGNAVLYECVQVRHLTLSLFLCVASSLSVCLASL